MKEIIATGKNLEKAIANGLEELNAKFEDVDVEVISEGGFFSKAKVKITLNGNEAPLPEEPFIQNKTVKEETKEQESESDGITVSLKKSDTTNKDLKELKSVGKKENSKKLKANSNSEKVENVENFLEKILELAGLNCSLNKEETEENIKININGECLNMVIGNKGECLSALQYITSLVKNEKEKGKKVILDAGDYKKNREDKVKELTLITINKVKNSGRWEKLKPMSAYERRIAHEIINETEGVKGESRGEEPNRYLTIYPDNK